MMAKLRTLRNEYRRNNGKYYASVRQLREYKKEQEQISKVQEENEKCQETFKKRT